MNAVKFEGMNVTYTAPGCGDLPSFVEVNSEEGRLVVTSCWKPSEEDLAVLNNGGCICLHVVGGQPPVAISAQHITIID